MTRGDWMGAFAIIGGSIGMAAMLWVFIPDRRADAHPRRQEGVTVFHDDGRRVTCWISPAIGMQAHGAGISCLPDATFAGAADNGRCQP